MTITFEEISGEVAPEPRHEESRGEAEERGVDDAGLDERILSVLARERRRAKRLSDR